MHPWGTWKEECTTFSEVSKLMCLYSLGWFWNVQFGSQSAAQCTETTGCWSCCENMTIWQPLTRIWRLRCAAWLCLTLDSELSLLKKLGTEVVETRDYRIDINWVQNGRGWGGCSLWWGSWQLLICMKIGVGVHVKHVMMDVYDVCYFVAFPVFFALKRTCWYMLYFLSRSFSQKSSMPVIGGQGTHKD